MELIFQSAIELPGFEPGSSFFELAGVKNKRLPINL
jgi:hypothetical protein